MRLLRKVNTTKIISDKFIRIHEIESSINRINFLQVQNPIHCVFCAVSNDMGRTQQRKRTPTPPPAEPKALDPLPPNTQAILRPGAEAVAYHIPVSPPSSSFPVLKSTIALPRRSRWTSGLHFHTTHTEYLRLIQGAIFVELDGRQMILSAKAGGQVSWAHSRELINEGLVIKVDKFARHNWGRAEGYMNSRKLATCVPIVYPEDIDEEVIVEEWTDPADISKALFFWNLNGFLTAPQNSQLPTRQSVLRLILGPLWVPFNLFIIFWELDNWPVFYSMRGITGPFIRESWGESLERLIEYIMTFIVLFGAKTLGRSVNIQGVTRDRTPDDLWEEYKKHC